jgi:hypothetical protein
MYKENNFKPNENGQSFGILVISKLASLGYYGITAHCTKTAWYWLEIRYSVA